jgi:hypothetical protein
MFTAAGEVGVMEPLPNVSVFNIYIILYYGVLVGVSWLNVS